MKSFMQRLRDYRMDPVYQKVHARNNLRSKLHHAWQIISIPWGTPKLINTDEICVCFPSI